MCFLLSLCVVVLSGCVLRPTEPTVYSPAVEQAVAFLAEEVPAWRPKNGCYSCHNNGDAARALYLHARLAGSRADPAADTTAWLRRPGDWERNAGEGEFRDEKLARLQFAAALVSADELGLLDDRSVLVTAAHDLARDQNEDGSWLKASSLGSPITYGPMLGTWMAQRTLRRADPEAFAGALRRADRWLRSRRPRTVMGAAALLLALAGARDEQARMLEQHCLDVIARGQARDGGWGPYVHAAPEAFDTALVLLALRPFQDRPDIAQRIARGRAFLLANQQIDGSWIETTRPSGAESYAHRVSTAAWATQALLLTEAR